MFDPKAPAAMSQEAAMKTLGLNNNYVEDGVTTRTKTLHDFSRADLSHAFRAKCKSNDTYSYLIPIFTHLTHISVTQGTSSDMRFCHEAYQMLLLKKASKKWQKKGSVILSKLSKQ